MNIIDIINKKKNKKVLSEDEIIYFIKNLNRIETYQISALLMAIVINGMNEEETIFLTNAMVNSGDKIEFNFNTVDKHSTGGVGDKVTLIVGPIVAALGCNVAKMSGRGLGYTGGTADKLESIKNFKIKLTEKEFVNQIKDINIAVITQTKNISPADKVLYSIRDVTATVESIPLIAASIMSKKIASGSKNLVLDVKVGNGAFMKNKKDALKLANLMVKIGEANGIKTRAILTNMDIPLGNNIGNKLEIKEVIDILKNNTDCDLKNVCIEIASQMVSLYHNISVNEAKMKVKTILDCKDAYNKFIEFIEYQKGTLEDYNYDYKYELKASSNGYLNIDALKAGELSVLLGAGRITKDDKIDYNAGIEFLRSVNDYVNEGDVLAYLYTSKVIKIDDVNIFSYNKKKINYEMIYEVV